MEIMGYYGDSFPLCYTHAGRAAAVPPRNVKVCEKMRGNANNVEDFSYLYRGIINN